jgi:hypothetical protein
VRVSLDTRRPPSALEPRKARPWWWDDAVTTACVEFEGARVVWATVVAVGHAVAVSVRDGGERRVEEPFDEDPVSRQAHRLVRRRDAVAGHGVGLALRGRNGHHWAAASPAPAVAHFDRHVIAVVDAEAVAA